MSSQRTNRLTNLPTIKLSRLAPTPSGFLHCGNAANFLLNARLARRGRLLLRIDDLDRGRFRPEYLEDIFAVIEWLGIEVTDGPTSPQDFNDNWSQETRLPLYRAALEKLRENELVFACPCTRKQLASGEHKHDCLSGRVDLEAKGVAWKLNTRKLLIQKIPDLINVNGFEVSPHESIPDFVVRTKAGRPSYQLACTVDDEYFGVTDVGRGQDLLPSTAAQSILSDLLGYRPLFDRISFVHHPLITEADGTKLSKSAGAQGGSELRDIVQLADLKVLVDEWLR